MVRYRKPQQLPSPKYNGITLYGNALPKIKAKLAILFKNHPKKLLVVAVLCVAYYFCLPKNLFNAPTATVVESKEGYLLGAKIADDGQWRFPMLDSVPTKFEKCLLSFEDAHFYRHPGFNPVSMVKAIRANLVAGKTVRGGSTLTQQVIRLSRQQNRRTYWQKLIEVILATRLEFRESKADILNLYASHAPFGGNVVGLDAAAWRYFGLRPHQLSWAESATLAVLPNAPSLIYPGKNQLKLLEKRNALLLKLFNANIIDNTTYTLALLEKLPQKPFPLPKTAPHFIDFMVKKARGQRVKSTVDGHLQQTVNAMVEKQYNGLRHNQVYNAAVLVLDVRSRKVLAYVGNTPTTDEHHAAVDMVQANRSTGSTLKPLLYAAMLDAGELLPNMLVPDIPTQIAGYTPENFNEGYSGAVAAKTALARSLNIPAVQLLQQYGLAKFRDQLKVFGLKGINKPADHYGLTLILGGAESSLWDLCKTYANLASTLNHFNSSSSEYYQNEFVEPILQTDQVVDFGDLKQEKTVFDAGSIYLTLEAMKEVNRPEGNESWQFFDSSKQIAWKTGTSFGNKDAWAIGATTNHVVGIWVGNADGEGRPDLTGLTSAAPLLFDVFDVLPKSGWFALPADAFVEISVCAQSGYLATENCPQNTMAIPNKRNFVKPCGFHQLVHLDAQGQFQVNSSCYDLSQARSVPWFVLPPLMEYYYKKTYPTYASLPAFRSNCEGYEPLAIAFIYPKNGQRITLAKNFMGEQNELILKLAHPKPEAVVYWYIDETFVGQTSTFHEIGIRPEQGEHTIGVVDSLGNDAHIRIMIE